MVVVVDTLTDEADELDSEVEELLAGLDVELVNDGELLDVVDAVELDGVEEELSELEAADVIVDELSVVELDVVELVAVADPLGFGGEEAGAEPPPPPPWRASSLQSCCSKVSTPYVLRSRTSDLPLQ